MVSVCKMSLFTGWSSSILRGSSQGHLLQYRARRQDSEKSGENSKVDERRLFSEGRKS